MKGCSKRTSEDEKIKHCSIKLKIAPDIIFDTRNSKIVVSKSENEGLLKKNVIT